VNIVVRRAKELVILTDIVLSVILCRISDIFPFVGMLVYAVFPTQPALIE
jgi:hypothetical protein